MIPALILMAVASVALASGGAAQAPPPPAAAPEDKKAPGDDIVVRAQREQDVIRRFVEDMTDPVRTDQVPRWEHRVCSGVIGIDPVQAEFLNARIGQTATLAGLRLDPAGCRPTILIIFSQDAAALAGGFAERFPKTLAQEGRARLNLFAKTTKPVRWISQIDISPYDGSPLLKGFINEPNKGRLSGSRIQASTRAVIAFMLVIVDSKQVSQVKLGALGNYLAMVALARPGLDAPPPAQSILSLFEPEHGDQAGLTDFDRSYLNALYKAPADQLSKAQSAAIRQTMQKDGAPSPP